MIIGAYVSLQASIMYSAFSEWFRHNKLFGSTEW